MYQWDNILRLPLLCKRVSVRLKNKRKIVYSTHYNEGISVQSGLIHVRIQGACSTEVSICRYAIIEE